MAETACCALPPSWAKDERTSNESSRSCFRRERTSILHLLTWSIHPPTWTSHPPTSNIHPRTWTRHPRDDSNGNRHAPASARSPNDWLMTAKEPRRSSDNDLRHAVDESRSSRKRNMPASNRTRTWDDCSRTAAKRERSWARTTRTAAAWSRTGDDFSRSWDDLPRSGDDFSRSGNGGERSSSRGCVAWALRPPSPSTMLARVVDDSFCWVPGRGPDPLALRRLERAFPRPLTPMGEAWFMGETRFTFDRFLAEPIANIPVNEIQELLYEITSGISSFGDGNGEWSSWFRYCVPGLIRRSHESYAFTPLLEPTISAFMNVFWTPDTAPMEAGVRDDLVRTLGTCIMKRELWVDARRRGWGQRWGFAAGARVSSSGGSRVGTSRPRCSLRSATSRFTHFQAGSIPCLPSIILRGVPDCSFGSGVRRPFFDRRRHVRAISSDASLLSHGRILIVWARGSARTTLSFPRYARARFSTTCASAWKEPLRISRSTGCRKWPKRWLR